MSELTVVFWSFVEVHCTDHIKAYLVLVALNHIYNISIADFIIFNLKCDCDETMWKLSSGPMRKYPQYYSIYLHSRGGYVKVEATLRL